MKKFVVPSTELKKVTTLPCPLPGAISARYLVHGWRLDLKASITKDPKTGVTYVLKHYFEVGRHDRLKPLGQSIQRLEPLPGDLVEVEQTFFPNPANSPRQQRRFKQVEERECKSQDDAAREWLRKQLEEMEPQTAA